MPKRLENLAHTNTHKRSPHDLGTCQMGWASFMYNYSIYGVRTRCIRNVNACASVRRASLAWFWQENQRQRQRRRRLLLLPLRVDRPRVWCQFKNSFIRKRRRYTHIHNGDGWIRPSWSVLTLLLLFFLVHFVVNQRKILFSLFIFVISICLFYIYTPLRWVRSSFAFVAHSFSQWFANPQMHKHSQHRFRERSTLMNVEGFVARFSVVRCGVIQIERHRGEYSLSCAFTCSSNCSAWQLDRWCHKYGKTSH